MNALTRARIVCTMLAEMTATSVNHTMNGYSEVDVERPVQGLYRAVIVRILVQRRSRSHLTISPFCCQSGLKEGEDDSLHCHHPNGDYRDRRYNKQPLLVL